MKNILRSICSKKRVKFVKIQMALPEQKESNDEFVVEMISYLIIVGFAISMSHLVLWKLYKYPILFLWV